MGSPSHSLTSPLPESAAGPQAGWPGDGQPAAWPAGCRGRAAAVL